MSTSAKLILGAYGVAVASYVLLVSAALITGGRTTLVLRSLFRFGPAAIALLLAYGVVLGEPVAFLQRGRDLGVTGLLLLLPAVLVYLPYRLVQDQMGLRRGLDTGLSTPDSLLGSPTHLHTWLLPYVTTRDVLGGATAYLFVGYLPLALALIAILWGRRPVAKAEGQPPISAWTRVGIMLDECGLPYKVRKYDLFKGEHRNDPAFMALNPAGAIPVIVDVRASDHNIDPTAIETAWTPQTKAVIPVHFAGLPCDMDEIVTIARAHGINVIDDAAHSFPSSYRGRSVGNRGLRPA